MPEYKRSVLEKYHVLEIYDCPKDIMVFAAQKASENVTIENFMHYGRRKAEFSFQIITKEVTVLPSLQKFSIDFTISKNEFLQLIDVWDEEGCYAVFHTITPLKFKATDLKENQRFAALNNFGWTLEIAIGGAASSGWSYFTSPDKKLIDELEAYLTNISNR